MLGTQNFFSPSARRRLVVVFTDGESRPYDVGKTVRRTPPGARAWRRCSCTSRHPAKPCSAPTGGRSRGTTRTPAAAPRSQRSPTRPAEPLSASARRARRPRSRAPRSARGPSRPGQGLTVRTRTLAPWFALAALLPLALAFVRGGAFFPPALRGGRNPRALPEPASAQLKRRVACAAVALALGRAYAGYRRRRPPTGRCRTATSPRPGRCPRAASTAAPSATSIRPGASGSGPCRPSPACSP